MMIQNFEVFIVSIVSNIEMQARGYDLLGINDYPDVKSLEKRFKDLGYTNVEVYDMLEIYNKHVDQTHRQRYNHLLY